MKNERGWDPITIIGSLSIKREKEQDPIAFSWIPSL